MKSKLILLLAAFFLCSAFKADKPVITIFMIGDSTMSNKSLVGGNPERGWGHVLPGFFSEDIRVDNHAMNGRSSKSFIDEGRWDKVLSLFLFSSGTTTKSPKPTAIQTREQPLMPTCVSLLMRLVRKAVFLFCSTPLCAVTLVRPIIKP